MKALPPKIINIYRNIFKLGKHSIFWQSLYKMSLSAQKLIVREFESYPNYSYFKWDSTYTFNIFMPRYREKLYDEQLFLDWLDGQPSNYEVSHYLKYGKILLKTLQGSYEAPLQSVDKMDIVIHCYVDTNTMKLLYDFEIFIEFMAEGYKEKLQKQGKLKGFNFLTDPRIASMHSKSIAYYKTKIADITKITNIVTNTYNTLENG